MPHFLFSAPSKIGDTCQRDCKPPLLCRDGRCECWGGSIVDGECVVPCPTGQQLYGVECTRVAHYGQMCEKDSQCVDPFNACVGGTCQCAPGTTRDVMRGFCYAVCPDGMHPRQTCRRLFVNDVDMLENAANTDSCPLGYRCVTYGSPYVGHCCRLRCPYGEPDLRRTQLRRRADTRLPRELESYPPLVRRNRDILRLNRSPPSKSSLNIFPASPVTPEHRLNPNADHSPTFAIRSASQGGWKSSLCCPRPCRDPTPLYINGQCLSIAHRDDPCQIDQQFNDDRFPTCEKSCNQLEEIASTDRCLPKAQLGHRCLSKKQCPGFADCRFGTCQCLCGYKQVRDNILGTRCTNPDDPLSLNTILTGVEQLFGNKRSNRN
ncbi:EB module [Ostertagia ostertagi]